MSLRLWPLALVLLGAPIVAQEPARDPLEEPVTIARTGTLKEHLALFFQLTGLRIDAPDSFDSPEADRPVEIHLEGVTRRSALEWITSLHGVGFVWREGRIRVTSAFLGYRADPVMKTYDGRGLSLPTAWAVPPRLGLGKELHPALEIVKEEPKPPGDEEGCCVSEEEVLVDLIKENVAPGTWEGNISIARDPMGNLLVTQTPQVHRELAWFLDALRAFPGTPVSVSLDLVEVDGSMADLLEAGAPTLYTAPAAEALARRFRSRHAKSFQSSGLAGERFQAFASEESGGVTGFLRGSPLVGRWLTEATLLVVRPTLLDHARSVFLDLRLSLGHTRLVGPVKTRPGLLPLNERQLSEFGTSLVIPSGGGVLLSLPSREAGRPTLALVRARPGGEPTEPLPPFLFSPIAEPGGEALAERLKAVPARTLELKEAPLSSFAAWIRDQAHVNVVVSPELKDETVSIRIGGTSLANILKLVLSSRDLDARVVHEALYIHPRVERRVSLQSCLLSLREVPLGAPDVAPRRDPESRRRGSWDVDDVVNLIKNYDHRGDWEEADGKIIQTYRGLLVARNNPRVLKDVIGFVEEQRKLRPELLRIRAEMLTLPEDRADELVGAAAGEGPAILDGAQVATLEKEGRSLERLAWVSLDRQETGFLWDRSRDYLYSVDGDDPILRAEESPSSLSIRPTLEVGEKCVMVDLRYEDRRLLELKEIRVSDDVVLQTPSVETVTANTTLRLPLGRTAVFRSSGRGGEGSPTLARLLLLSIGPAE